MSDLLIGKVLASYRVERMLGKGGMGAVYEGVHTETGAKAAIKVMMRSLREDPELVHRFEREARVAAKVRHTNVARVLDAGASDDVRYIAMEFIDGEPLNEMLKEKGRLAGPRTLDFMRQAACGLEAAFEAGIIHRDIKPANLMVTREGVVKIVDFGLAKTEKPDSLHTQTGAVMGTPHYMSPEQATGNSVDHRADIYSLGATFYQLLTGHTPFDGETALMILQKHISEPVRAIQHWNPNVPEPICQTVYRMMAKHPDERFQTYGHLIRVLDDLIAGRGAPTMTMDVVDSTGAVAAGATTAPAGVPGAWKRLATVGVVILAVVAAALVWRGRRSQDDTTEEAGAESGLERKAKQFQNETVPLLREIKEFNEEQDAEERKFSSRRAKMNRGGDEDF